MPTINLLPWREELRQKRKKEFFMALFMALLVGAGVTFGTKLVYEAKISSQQQRNDMLRTEIKALDKQIAEIKDLQERRRRLVERTDVIQELERSRPEEVHLVDSVVDVIPPGAYLTELKQTGKRIELKGSTQSSARVTTLMRRINDSDWLKTPQLGGVNYPTNGGPNARGNFTVSATQIGMDDDEDDEAAQEASQ